MARIISLLFGSCQDAAARSRVLIATCMVLDCALRSMGGTLRRSPLPLALRPTLRAWRRLCAARLPTHDLPGVYGGVDGLEKKARDGDGPPNAASVLAIFTRNPRLLAQWRVALLGADADGGVRPWLLAAVCEADGGGAKLSLWMRAMITERCAAARDAEGDGAVPALEGWLTFGLTLLEACLERAHGGGAGSSEAAADAVAGDANCAAAEALLAQLDEPAAMAALLSRWYERAVLWMSALPVALAAMEMGEDDDYDSEMDVG